MCVCVCVCVGVGVVRACVCVCVCRGSHNWVIKDAGLLGHNIRLLAKWF